jgi:hypothetical protein
LRLWLKVLFVLFLLLNPTGRVFFVPARTLIAVKLLRHISLPSPVSPDRNSYSLLESLLELYARFLRFLLFAFYLAFLNGLVEHGRHIRQTFLAPMIFVRLILL